MVTYSTLTLGTHRRQASTLVADPASQARCTRSPGPLQVCAACQPAAYAIRFSRHRIDMPAVTR